MDLLLVPDKLVSRLVIDKHHRWKFVVGRSAGLSDAARNWMIE